MTVTDVQRPQHEEQQAQYVQAATDAMQDKPSAPANEMSALGGILIAEFQQAENNRRDTELRWLQDLRQYRGIYDAEVLERIGKYRSKAFVRKTRVKVKTTDARMTELLFPGNSEKSYLCEPTPVAKIAPELKKQLVELVAKQLGRVPSEIEVQEAIKKAAESSAKAMTNTIDDQLNEAKYKEVSKKVIHSGNLYGTGILKAPLVERKIRHRYIFDGKKWSMKTESYVIPFVDYVPIWNFYPDMAAVTIEECRYVYERHVMTKAGLFKLSERKSFNTKKIIDYIEAHPDGSIAGKYFEQELKAIGDRVTVNTLNSGQYDVIERWGYLSGQQLSDNGVKVPNDRLHEAFFSNIWMLPNGDIIRAVLQPINGVTWPYHLYYFDKDETSIFGEGIATIMRDDQTMMNAATRMMLDNAAISAGAQLEVNTKLVTLTGEQLTEIHPWKVWPRSGEDAASRAVNTIDIQGHLPELGAIADRFENNADEVTAIPRYMSGENVTTGAAGTSSGMSMLMGAAGVAMKDLVGSYDGGITRPFIEALYRWNMQFNPNAAIKGDFDIKANGVASMVAKEVRAQQLDQFSALAANPLDAPYIKRDKLLRQRAEAHELVDVVKTEEEVLAEMNNPQSQAAQQMAIATQQLQYALLEKQVEKLAAEVMNLRAQAVNKNVSSAYAAMQAGGVAVQSPDIAPAGDEILRSAGFKDETPQVTNAEVVGEHPQPQAEPVPVQPQPEPTHENMGMHKGMRTPEIEPA